MSNLKDARYTKIANKPNQEDKKTTIIEHRIAQKNNINLKPFQYTYKIVMNKREKSENKDKVQIQNSNLNESNHLDNFYSKNEKINQTSKNYNFSNLKESFNYNEELKKFSYFLYKHKHEDFQKKEYQNFNTNQNYMMKNDENILNLSISDLKIKRKLKEQDLLRHKSIGNKKISNNSRNMNNFDDNIDNNIESDFNSMKNNLDIPTSKSKHENHKNKSSLINMYDNNLISFNPDIIEKYNKNINEEKINEKGNLHYNPMLKSRDDMYLLSNDIDFRNSLINTNLSISVESKKNNKSVNALINLSSEEMNNNDFINKNLKQSEKIEFYELKNDGKMDNLSKSGKSVQEFNSIPIIIEKDMDRFKKLMIEISEYFLLKKFMTKFINNTIKEEEIFLDHNCEYYEEKQRIYKLIYNFALFKKTSINTFRGKKILQEEYVKAKMSNNRSLSMKIFDLLKINQSLNNNKTKVIQSISIKNSFSLFFKKLKDNANNHKIVSYCNYKRINKSFSGLKQLLVDKKIRIKNILMFKKFYNVRICIKALKINNLRKENRINNNRLVDEFRKNKLKKELLRILINHYKIMISFNKNNIFKKSFNLNTNINMNSKRKEISESEIKNYKDNTKSYKNNERYVDDDHTKEFVVFKIENKKSIYHTDKGFKTVISKKVNLK